MFESDFATQLLANSSFCVNGKWCLLCTIYHSRFINRLPARRVVASNATPAITTPATTAATAIAAKTTATTTAASATAAILAWSGFVNCQVTTGKVGAIELLDRFLAFLLGSHFNKT